MFSSNQTTRYTDNSFSRVFEATARFDPSNAQLGIEWAWVGTAYNPSNIVQQSTVTPFSAFIIDGAQYD